MLLAALTGCGTEPETTVTDTQSGYVSGTDVQSGPDATEPGDDTEAPDAEPVPIEKFTIGGVPLSDFCVVVADGAASGVKNAAEDLIMLVKFAAGIDLQLRSDKDGADHAIILGTTERDGDKIISAREEVKSDGYALVEDNGNLYISGVINRGTMNGVYDFLEDHLGIRFYSDTFTYVRKDGIRNVETGQKTVFNPVFSARYNWCRAEEENNTRFIKRTKSTSIKYGGSHNLGSLSGTGDGVSKQPCLSDPDVFDTVLENLCKQIDKKPTKTFFHINQNDGGAFCKCAECTAKNEAAGGTCMGSLLIFINQIADAVKDRYPDRQIDILTYAYKETTKAPDPSYVKPRDNVIITLCMMDSTCFTHAYPDPECEKNCVSYANMIEWSKITDKLCIYDYSYNHASQISSVGPNLDVLYDNIQAFRDLGCVGMLMEGDHLSDTGEFVELRNFLINQLMWDPDITREQYYQLWDEFMEDYYGEAAPYIREYIDLLNATSRRTGLTAWDGHTSVYTDPSVFYAPEVDGKKDYTVINKCAELWEAALSCRLDDDQFAHVEKSSVHFRDFLSRYGDGNYVKVNAKHQFNALCDKYAHNWDGKLATAGDTEGYDANTPSEDLDFRVAPDGTAYVSDVGTLEAGILVVPTEYNGAAVTAVGNSAFARAGVLVEAHIPEGITKIGTYAFRGAPNLKAVYLPKSLETLGFGALGLNANENYVCPALADIYYAGTLAEWQALYGQNNAAWKTLEGTSVHCSDGDAVM